MQNKDSLSAAGNALPGKIPPNHLQAEQSVLGCAMSSEKALAEITAILKTEDFYRPDHRLIFDAICEIYMSGKAVDIITVSDALESKSILEKVGGLSYVSRLPDLVPFMSNAPQYADLVRQKAILRKLIISLDEINSLCYEDARNANELLSVAAKRIYDIRENRDASGFESLKDIMGRTINEISELSRSHTNDRLVRTGFVRLDRALGGIGKGALVILAARPAMGKTAFALNIAQKTAMLYKVPVAIFSLEMSKEEVGNRMLSAQALINSRSLRSGELRQEDWDKISKALPVLYNTEVYIDDRSGTNVMEMMSKCRQLKLEGRLGIVIIDYLQLMSSGSGKVDSRQQEISEITRSLKIMAKDLHVPIIALSQLSRACEARQDKRPMLSDLRDSGSIEQDADVVMFLYRDHYYQQDQMQMDIEEAEVIVAKNRSGQTGTVKMNWWAKHTMFFEPEDESMPADPMSL
ncbi:MAG: replicative DNA helicase [Saccharofermentanales bacterium]